MLLFSLNFKSFAQGSGISSLPTCIGKLTTLWIISQTWATICLLASICFLFWTLCCVPSLGTTSLAWLCRE
ncbi:hypothetical protein LINPERPRIM_LOCUS5688 [Linum perenne]